MKISLSKETQKPLEKKKSIKKDSSANNSLPIFQLRFVKKGKKNIYYRVLVSKKDNSNR